MAPTARQRVETVLAYHRRTKHHLHRYARAAGFLDWANQPDPFRTYAGAPVVDLPLLADALTVSYDDLHRPQRVRPRRADLPTVAILFELALGLSAWKQSGSSRWALRCNPSSGNLHPTEGYALLPAHSGLTAGVYHYVSFDHRLEQRCALSGIGAVGSRANLPSGCFLVGLSSIFWREAWKYGERAGRYCYLDLGHALAAIRYAAATLGWSALLLDHLGDDQIARWLGLDRDADYATIDPLDREHPEALLLVGPPPLLPAPSDPRLFEDEVFQGASWAGSANALSPEHVHWQIIDELASAARKPATPPRPFELEGPVLPPLAPSRPVPAATLIRQRRSCLALDGRTAVDAEVLFNILDHLLPRPGVPPFDVLLWMPRLHLALFVHLVRGLEPGLYLLERNQTDHASLRASLSARFEWQRPANCPEHLRLFQLAEGDYRALARQVSCHQEIASDGSFSLGMLAPMSVVQREGPWCYPRLFWEAGVIGQALYLEAEANGVRGTGIGCYFDDSFHQLLGLKGEEWQSLYHFTVGGPVEDRRLRTLAPYAHLSGR